jgi:hypothetical protein
MKVFRLSLLERPLFVGAVFYVRLFSPHLTGYDVFADAHIQVSYVDMTSFCTCLQFHFLCFVLSFKWNFPFRFLNKNFFPVRATCPAYFILIYPQQ